MISGCKRDRFLKRILFSYHLDVHYYNQSSWLSCALFNVTFNNLLKKVKISPPNVKMSSPLPIPPTENGNITFAQFGRVLSATFLKDLLVG